MMAQQTIPQLDDPGSNVSKQSRQQEVLAYGLDREACSKVAFGWLRKCGQSVSVIPLPGPFTQH